MHTATIGKSFGRFSPYYSSTISNQIIFYMENYSLNLHQDATDILAHLNIDVAQIEWHIVFPSAASIE